MGARSSKPVGDGQPRHRPVLLDVLQALREETLSDHVLMVAAGLAFYAAFGLLPALAAAAALWGQVEGFDALKHLMESGNGLLPQGSIQVLQQFVTSVPEQFGGGVGLLVNLALVVWTSYRAASGLLTALNIVYDVTEKRGWLRRAAVALAIGTCGIALLFAALAIALLPLLLTHRLPPQLVTGLRWLRWLALAVVFALSLSLLFRYAPSRDQPRWRWIGCGALAAALLWIAASAGVSFYVARVASFGRLYGSLGSIAVILLWFYASALAILAGAEIDAILAAQAQGRPPARLKSDLRRRERAT